MINQNKEIYYHFSIRTQPYNRYQKVLKPKILNLKSLMILLWVSYCCLFSFLVNGFYLILLYWLENLILGQISPRGVVFKSPCYLRTRVLAYGKKTVRVIFVDRNCLRKRILKSLTKLSAELVMACRQRWCILSWRFLKANPVHRDETKLWKKNYNSTQNPPCNMHGVSNWSAPSISLILPCPVLICKLSAKFVANLATKLEVNFAWRI